MATEFEKSLTPVDKSVDNRTNDPNAVIDPQTGKPPVEVPQENSVLKQFDQQIRGITDSPRDQSTIKNHNHDGTNSSVIDIKNIGGLIQVLTDIPTSKPTKFYDQIKLVVTGGNTYLYVFNPVANDWLEVQLTT